VQRVALIATFLGALLVGAGAGLLATEKVVFITISSGSLMVGVGLGILADRIFSPSVSVVRPPPLAPVSKNARPQSKVGRPKS
jgi:hypothetical protein